MTFDEYKRSRTLSWEQVDKPDPLDIPQWRLYDVDPEGVSHDTGWLICGSAPGMWPEVWRSANGKYQILLNVFHSWADATHFTERKFWDMERKKFEESQQAAA